MPWVSPTPGETRTVLSLALLAVAASLPLMELLPSAPVVLLAVLAAGTGSLIVEVATETVLQEQLPDDVFARAYGFAYPASIGATAVTDGPFTEAREVIGGFALVKVDSKQQAVDIAERFASLFDEVTVEVRLVAEFDEPLEG